MRNPTLRQIRIRCKQIQKTWTPEERDRRIADFRLRSNYMDRWLPPSYDDPRCDQDFENYLDRLN